MNAQDLEIFRNSFGDPMTRAEAEDFIYYAESLGYKIEIMDNGNVLMQHPDDDDYPEVEYVEENSDILVNGEDNYTRIVRVMGEWWDSLSAEEREELEQEEEE